MDHEATMWRKKEEADEFSNERGSMFLDASLKTEELSLHIKKDPEMKHSVDGSVHNFIESPLGISWSCDFIKEEPELHLEGEETEHVVVNQSRLESEKMLIQNSDDNGNISLEANVKEGVVPSDLATGAQESTHFTKLISHQQGLASQEDSTFGTRLNCRLREKKLQKFNCSVCLCSFHSKYRLIMHVFIHIGRVHPPAYVCKLCGEVFSSNVSLNKHLKESECDEVSPAGQSDAIDCVCNYENLLEGERVSSPEMHEKHFSTMETRNISKKYFHGMRRTHTVIDNVKKRDICDNYGTLNTNGAIKDHTVPHTAKRGHKCELCGKSFTHLGNLTRHALIHTGVRQHKCDVCGKSFTQLVTLKQHSVIHTHVRQHKCGDCGKSFTHLRNLKRHALIHTGMKQHKCDVCGISFAQLVTLKRHAVIHTRVRQHKCDVCGKCLTTLRNLKRHAVIHTEVRQHKCDVCGKCFTQLCNLKQHALIHTGMRQHKCDVCGKSFTQLVTLKQHALIHTGMRPHKCDVCGKCFTQLGNLKMHTLIHTGIRQHKCGDCGKSFTHPVHLKRHALIHTRMRPHKY